MPCQEGFNSDTVVKSILAALAAVKAATFSYFSDLLFV